MLIIFRANTGEEEDESEKRRTQETKEAKNGRNGSKVETTEENNEWWWASNAQPGVQMDILAEFFPLPFFVSFCVEIKLWHHFCSTRCSFLRSRAAVKPKWHVNYFIKLRSFSEWIFKCDKRCSNRLYSLRCSLLICDELFALTLFAVPSICRIAMSLTHFWHDEMHWMAVAIRRRRLGKVHDVRQKA